MVSDVRTKQYGQCAGDTHPTGMHSCSKINPGGGGGSGEERRDDELNFAGNCTA